MKIQNRHIPLIINFIDNMNLKGRASLGRTKLKEKLSKQNESVTQDQVAIIDEFDGWTDKEKGQFTNENPEMNKAINELLLDYAEIDYKSPFKQDFIDALETYEEELSGKDADIYALLYETLIDNEEEK